MPRTIAPEIIACIAHGGEPSETDLQRVAAHIRRDLELALGVGGRPGQPVSDRVAAEAIRAARAALEGTP